MVVSYWCVPCTEDAARFSPVIAGLAAAQGAPVFQAHMTLGTLERADKGVAGVADALKGLTLMPVEIGRTDLFTMSLFVRLAPSEALLAARAELEQLPGFRPGRKFDPHISLCYGAPPDGHGLDREIEALLDAPVRFGGLAGINASLPVETHDDVASWTVAETYRL